MRLKVCMQIDHVQIDDIQILPYTQRWPGDRGQNMFKKPQTIYFTNTQTTLT